LNKNSFIAQDSILFKPVLKKGTNHEQNPASRTRTIHPSNPAQTSGGAPGAMFETRRICLIGVPFDVAQKQRRAVMMAKPMNIETRIKILKQRSGQTEATAGSRTGITGSQGRSVRWPSSSF